MVACKLGANSLINSSFANRLDYELIPAVWSSAAIPPHHRPDSTSIEALIASYRAFSAVLSVFGSNWGYLVLGRKKNPPALGGRVLEGSIDDRSLGLFDVIQPWVEME
jgi:hypothetical protein